MPKLRTIAWILLTAASAGSAACAAEAERETVVTISGSNFGAEREVLLRQVDGFMAERPEIRVKFRVTPDAADQRHQLYVQWLSARARDPDILWLDVIWTAEFAGAGWILPLDRFGPDTSAFFPSVVEANSWEGRLYALPLFVDVGMLYWRTDLMDSPPATLDDLARVARGAMARDGLPYGFVWQGARYEGLVTVFLEHLGAFGGEILDEAGAVVVDEEPAVRALRFMREAIRDGIVPRSALTWQEEPTRFAFQNGQAAFMRNWPYAFPVMQDSAESRVAGRFSVAPMPAGEGGRPSAALGGNMLAINSNTEYPEAAYALIEYLTRPEQMLERARVVGQFPTRQALYDDPELARALPIPAVEARRIIERAVPRPVTPVYTELSQILQVRLHRALTGQQEPEAALADAAREMRNLLRRVGLEPGESVAAGR